MDISCSPLYNVCEVSSGRSQHLRNSGEGSYGIKNPRDVVIRDYENGFTLLSELV